MKYSEINFLSLQVKKRGHCCKIYVENELIFVFVCQDLPGAGSITDLHEGLALSEAGDRKLFLIGTYVRKGDADLSSGVQDARDLIFQMVCDGR